MPILRRKYSINRLYAFDHGVGLSSRKRTGDCEIEKKGTLLINE